MLTGTMKQWRMDCDWIEIKRIPKQRQKKKKNPKVNQTKD